MLLRASASDPSDEVRLAAHAALEALPLGAEAVRPLLDSFLLAAPAVEEYSRKRLRPQSSPVTSPQATKQHSPAEGTAVSGALHGLTHAFVALYTPISRQGCSHND